MFHSGFFAVAVETTPAVFSGKGIITQYEVAYRRARELSLDATEPGIL